MKNLMLLTILMSLLGGCAAKPVVNMENVDRKLTPTQARSQFDRFEGTKVVWGGMIINTRNLEEHTQIEVLAFPLENDGEPKREATPMDRFVLKRDGYLEPAQYQQGRWLTVRGKLAGIEPGKIGETDYAYPVIQAEQLHLWPRETAPREGSSSFHFGIGVTIGN